MIEKNYEFLLDYIKYNIMVIEKSNLVDKNIILSTLYQHLSVDISNKNEMDVVISKLFRIHQSVNSTYKYVDFDRYTLFDGIIK